MENKLRKLLRQGKVAFGITVTIGHPDITDILGDVGFDYINFDTQHAPLNIDTVQNMIQAMSYSQTTPIVRVQWNDFAMINRALDIGAHAIIVPLVNTKKDVIQALRYATYPPIGTRSYGPRRAMMRDPEYMTTADQEVLVLPQIETKEAIDNMESILSVDQIEAFFVGPYDLSRSLGVFTQWNHPIFEKAMEKIINAAESSGTKPGLLALIEDPEKTIKRGFRLVNIGKDASFMTRCATSALQRAKTALSTKTRLEGE